MNEYVLQAIAKDEGGFLRCPTCQAQLWAEFEELGDLNLSHLYTSMFIDDTVQIRVNVCRQCDVGFVDPERFEKLTKKEGDTVVYHEYPDRS